MIGWSRLKTLVISKPMYSYILPLVEFPDDGDNFFIQKSIDVISSYGSIIALTLGKYNVDVDFTGAVGGDDLAIQIKEKFEKNNVKVNYLERYFGEKTAISYKIYNQKTNRFTTISEIGSKIALTKYKYDFLPNVIIMDDSDYNANLAAINNYPDALKIYVGDKYNKESSVYCNKCNYVISTLSFASGATGITEGLNKSKNIVALFQKYIDLYGSQLIIKLDNFDVLYCVNDEVRMIKNVNRDIKNKDSIYYSVLIYFIINNIDIENAIKLTNKVMLSSANEIDLISDIPEFNVIELVLNEYKTIEESRQAHINNIQNQEQIETLNNNQNNIEQTELQSQQPNVVNQEIVGQSQQVIQPEEQFIPNQNNNFTNQNIFLNNQNINTDGVNNGQSF